MILLIDNYDSFAHNLARYLRRLGSDVDCRRNDALSVTQIGRLKPQLIVLSPGPGTPTESGVCLDVVRDLGDHIPLLGVCLGHQAIAQAGGARIVRTSDPCHGMASEITHDGLSEFAGMPNPFLAGRYHSLIVDPELPDTLEVSARASDGTIMAIRHTTRPSYGWQFHPESILTEHGYALLGNLLRMVGINVVGPPTIDSERIPSNDVQLEPVVSRQPDASHPRRPISF